MKNTSIFDILNGNLKNILMEEIHCIRNQQAFNNTTKIQKLPLLLKQGISFRKMNQVMTGTENTVGEVKKLDIFPP